MLNEFLGRPRSESRLEAEADEGQVGEALEVPAGDGLDSVAVQVELVDGGGHLGGHLLKVLWAQLSCMRF